MMNTLFDERLSIVERMKETPKGTVSFAWLVFLYEWNGFLIEAVRIFCDE